MKNRTTFLAALLLALAVPSFAVEGWTYDLNLLLAGKGMHKDDWEPTHRHGELGLQYTFGNPNWPLRFAMDLLASGDKADYNRNGYTEQRAATSELDLGVRKIWGGKGLWRPYFGGGIALVSGYLERRGPNHVIDKDEDDGAGLWLGGGLMMTFKERWNVGLDLKASGANTRLFNRRLQGGGLHFGLLLGGRWGA